MRGGGQERRGELWGAADIGNITVDVGWRAHENAANLGHVAVHPQNLKPSHCEVVAQRHAWDRLWSAIVCRRRCRCHWGGRGNKEGRGGCARRLLLRRR